MGFVSTYPTAARFAIRPPQRRVLADGAWTTSEIMAEAILCEAKKWIGIKENPAGSNCGPEIDVLHKEYDPSWKKSVETCRPYCAIAVWVWVNRAAKRLGGKNLLPGYAETLGNALDTLQTASRVGLVVDATPAQGAVFYRRSDDKKNSGHMGVVESWDGKTLVTIEGNQGTTHRIDRFSYTAAHVTDPAMGYRFIHTERMPHSTVDGSPAFQQLLADCRAPRRIISTEVVTMPTTPTSFTLPPMPGTGIAVPPTTPGTPPTDPPATTPCVVKDTDCTAIKAGDAIPHYSLMQSPEVAGDVFNADWGFCDTKQRYNSAGDWWAARNGAAMGVLKQSQTRDEYSSGGVFTDRNSNLFIVVRTFAEGGKSPMMKIMQDGKLLDTNQCYWYNLKMDGGGGSGEAAALMMMGRDMNKKFFGDYDARPGGRAPWARDGEWRRGIPGISGGGQDFNRVHDGLRWLESKGQKFDRPVLITVEMDKGLTVDKVVDAVLNAVKPFAATIGIPPALFDSLKNVIVTLVETGGNLDWAQAAKAAVQLVDLLVPEELRNEAIKLANQAVTLVKELGNDALYFGNQIKKYGVEFAASLGVTAASLNAWGGSIESVYNRIVSGDYAKIITDSTLGPHAANQVLNSFLTQNIVDTVRKKLASGSLTESVIDNGLLGTPILRQMLYTGTTNVVLGGIPGVNELCGQILKTPELSTRTGINSQLVGAFLKVGLGYKVNPSAFDGLALDALRAQAETILQNGGKSFILPQTIPCEKRSCWVIELKKDFKQLDFGITSTPRDKAISEKISTGSPTTAQLLTGGSISINTDSNTVRPAFVPVKTTLTVPPSNTATVQPTVPPVTVKTLPPTELTVPATPLPPVEVRTPKPAFTPEPPVVVQQQCPPGYTLIDGKCIPPPPVMVQQQCPPGYRLENGKCLPPPVIVEQQECPPGYRLEGNRCIPPPVVVESPTVITKPAFTPQSLRLPPVDRQGQPPTQPAPPTPQQPMPLPPPAWAWPPYPVPQPCQQCGGCGCDSCMDGLADCGCSGEQESNVVAGFQ